MKKATLLAMRSVHLKTFIKNFSHSTAIQANIRGFANTPINYSQQQQKQELLSPQYSKEGIEKVDVKNSKSIINLTFDDDSKGYLPFLWLRDNCQCSSCFDKNALARSFLLQDLDMKSYPKEVKNEGDILRVIWNDDHKSDFCSKWLYERAFNNRARKNYRNLHRLQMHPWGKEIKLDKFSYNDLVKDDKTLLKWLLTMEVKGVSLIKKAPNDTDAGPKFIEHVGFVKQTHYGRRSPVVVRENKNNLAFSSVKLGLHNDLTQYYQQPGLIFIHTVEQHKGKGGESTISDGLLAAEIMRRKNPKAFNTLTKTNAYFWDKGHANNPMESEEFYKINKGPIIGLNCDGEFEIMRMNNQVRDSHVDLPPEEVNTFYEAMKTLFDTLQDNSYSFKMEDGDILALDNVRCLHGREKFDSKSGRHLESSYLDWDETLCRRRRLLEKLGYSSPPKELL